MRLLVKVGGVPLDTANQVRPGLMWLTHHYHGFHLFFQNTGNSRMDFWWENVELKEKLQKEIQKTEGGNTNFRIFFFNGFPGVKVENARRGTIPIQLLCCFSKTISHINNNKNQSYLSMQTTAYFSHPTPRNAFFTSSNPSSYGM